MSNQQQTMVAGTVVTVCALGTVAVVLLLIVQRKRQRQTAYVRAGQVEQLYIYPIKSCKGNKVDWLDCGERGSVHDEQRDRHFLVVDSMRHNQMLTGRIYPRMLLIRAHVEHDVLCVQFPDRNPVQVRLKEVQQHNHVRRARSWPASQLRMVGSKSGNWTAPVRHHPKNAREWQLQIFSKNQFYDAIKTYLCHIPKFCDFRLFSDLQTDGLDCGDEVAKALDEFLLPKEGDARDSRKLRLIYFGGDWLYTERDAKPEQRWWLNNAVPEVKDKIAYADLAGYMAFSSASVDDINAHLASQEIRVDARNFRPNLVISGLPPFDEDRWLYVRAGDAEFACYKPCTRCVMTTIDPDSGCRNAKMEPLKELRKYRLAPGKLYEIFKESPVFGVNMAIIKPGRVRIGDPVWIRYKPRPF